MESEGSARPVAPGEQTVELSTVSRGDRRRRDRQGAPTLTVVYHPRVDRVGERAVLAGLEMGHAVRLSRVEPGFDAPAAGEGDADSGNPLADPYLSRSPLLLTPLPGGGVRLVAEGSRTAVQVDGVPVDEHLDLPAERVDRGAVLLLAGRVVLLLHRSGDAAAAGGGGCAGFGMVGESAAMVAACREVRRVAELDVAVLLRGPTGTGKELMAQALHRASRRRDGPFVSVNLAAVPPSLAASELFGAVKGAFTGSVAAQPGFFQRAQGGTLFLDEVGDAPPEVQAALLRVLETGEVQRVGAQAPLSVDVRLVAATDLDLEAASERGDFRGQLLHRLAGYEITLPPLAERRDDFGRLLVHFLRQELQQLGEGRRLLLADPSAEPWLPASIVARLARHAWPGNVRQLRNVARQLAVAGRGTGQVRVNANVERLLREAEAGGGASTPAHALQPPTDGPAPQPSPPPAAGPPSGGYRSPADVGEEELIIALRAHQWQVKPTAEALGVSRPSLYNLMDKSPRVRKAADLSDAELTAARQRHGGDLDAMVEDLEVSRAALEQRLRALDGGS